MGEVDTLCFKIILTKNMLSLPITLSSHEISEGERGGSFVHSCSLGGERGGGGVGPICSEILSLDNQCN